MAQPAHLSLQNFGQSSDLPEIFLDSTDDFESIISIYPLEFPPPLSIERSDNGCINSWMDNMWELGNSRSQDHQVLYRPNGAIYGAKWNAFSGNFYTSGRTYGYVMPRLNSLDIDTMDDLIYARFLFEKGYV